MRTKWLVPYVYDSINPHIGWPALSTQKNNDPQAYLGGPDEIKARFQRVYPYLWQRPIQLNWREESQM